MGCAEPRRSFGVSVDQKVIRCLYTEMWQFIYDDVMDLYKWSWLSTIDNIRTDNAHNMFFCSFSIFYFSGKQAFYLYNGLKLARKE